MPTGYTCKITEGTEEVTGRSFIMNCAKAFGACISMRDESSNMPIPEEFQPNIYYENMIESSKKDLLIFQQLSTEDYKKQIEIDYQKSIKEKGEGIKSKLIIRDRYLKILEEVKNWNIPTEEHRGLKDFAIQQLEDSMKWDCDVKYYTEQIIKRKSVEKYKKERIERLKENIKYYTEKNQEEIDRVKERNLWVKQLRDSLE